MKIIPLIVWMLVIAVQPVFAHGGSHDQSHAHVIPAAVEAAHVSITELGGYRLVESNGIPGHKTGRFPNRGNPNSISAQSYHFRMPLHPAQAGQVTKLTNRMDFGVALNGIPFDPGTAEFYNNDPRSGWVLEAITGGRDLGLDSNNAHVQPDGAYHYHGIPWGMAAYFPHDGPDGLMLAGYAADGFPVYMPAEKGIGPKASYRVKEGLRPSGPGGSYDGKYTQDWEYVAGIGALDECNGMQLAGGYAYILTEQFPFIPRCFRGTPDNSFMKSPPSGGRGDRRRPPPDMRPDIRPPPGPL